MFAAIGSFANETNNVFSNVDEWKDKEGKFMGSYEDFFAARKRL